MHRYFEIVLTSDAFRGRSPPRSVTRITEHAVVLALSQGARTKGTAMHEDRRTLSDTDLDLVCGGRLRIGDPRDPREVAKGLLRLLSPVPDLMETTTGLHAWSTMQAVR